MSVEAAPAFLMFIVRNSTSNAFATGGVSICASTIIMSTYEHVLILGSMEIGEDIG